MKVSYSQVDQFNRCKFAWSLSYLEGWTSKEKSNSLDIGSLVDQYLNSYYQNIRLTDRDNCMKTIEQAVGIEFNARNMDPTALKNLQLAARIVQRYVYEFAPENDKNWEILDVQKHFEIPMLTSTGNEFVLEGYIDVVAKDKNSGKLWIWDHKTIDRTFWTETKAMIDPQLTIYMAGLRAQGVPIVGLVYNMLNRYDYKEFGAKHPDELFRRLETHRSQDELNNYLLEMYDTVDEMIAAKAGIVKTRRTINRNSCEYCFFQEPCLLNLKGIPIGPLMEASFKQKEHRKEAITY